MALARIAKRQQRNVEQRPVGVCVCVCACVCVKLDVAQILYSLMCVCVCKCARHGTQDARNSRLRPQAAMSTLQSRRLPTLKVATTPKPFEHFEMRRAAVQLDHEGATMPGTINSDRLLRGSDPTVGMSSAQNQLSLLLIQLDFETLVFFRNLRIY